MPGRVSVGFASDSVLLHAWRNTVDELSSCEGLLDPAHMVRLSCVLEGVRLVADAADVDPAGLRRAVVDDLRLFVLRLSRDFGRSFPAGGCVVPFRKIDLSSGLLALAGVLDCLADRIRPDGFVARDGKVDMDDTGWVDRRAMMTWVSRSHTESEALDDVLLANETGDSEIAALARDGWSLVTVVACIAAALSDTNLVEVEPVTDRLALAAAICDQAIDRCDAIATVRADHDVDAVRAAFVSLASVVEEGQDILDVVCGRLADSRHVVSWRLLSKGRAIVADADVADLFENGVRTLDTVATLDLDTARAFGVVARSLRTEWVA